MEIALIIIMIILAFKSQLIEIFTKNAATAMGNAESLLKYLGATATLSLSISVLPAFCMIIYMRNEGFFAFELFSGHSHAFNVLAGNIFVNFLILTLGFFGAAFLFAAKADKVAIFLVSLLNAVFIGYFVLLAYITSAWVVVAAIFIITCIIAGYLFFWSTSSLEVKAKLWRVPLIVAAIILLLPIFAQTGTSKITGTALAQMKVGGMMVTIGEPSEILEKGQAEKINKKWLVLRSPEALYIKDTQSSSVVTVLKADGFVVTPLINGN